MTLDFYFRAFSISRKADNHARSVPLEASRPEEIRKRKSSGGIDDFFSSRGDSFKGQWYRLESYSKARKGTLRGGFILLFRWRRESEARITPTPTPTTTTTSTSTTSSPSSPSSPWRDDLDFTRCAREGRFTIHKTTRRIELSSLARSLRQLPVPFATGRAARICIIPFASTILIGGLFQSLSLRIFAFALLYLPWPAAPRRSHSSPSHPLLNSDPDVFSPRLYFLLL